MRKQLTAGSVVPAYTKTTKVLGLELPLFVASGSAHEAGMISARTKAALAAAKRRGKTLGGDRGARLTAKARAAGRAVLKARA